MYRFCFTTGWTPEAWAVASSTDRADATKSPGINGKVSAYLYYNSNENLKTSSSAIRKKLIFGENNSKYWLSTRGIDAASHYAYFGPGWVYNNQVCSCNGDFSSDGSDMGNAARALGVRPVIYLDSNISMTSAGTTDNVTTWNID